MCNELHISVFIKYYAFDYDIQGVSPAAATSGQTESSASLSENVHPGGSITDKGEDGVKENNESEKLDPRKAMMAMLAKRAGGAEVKQNEPSPPVDPR